MISHPGYEKRIPKLNSKKSQSAAVTLLRGHRSMRADLIRDCIGEIDFEEGDPGRRRRGEGQVRIAPRATDSLAHLYRFVATGFYAIATYPIGCATPSF